MTPEDAKRLDACVQEIAAILCKDTPSEHLASLESLELTVRQQVIEHISPQGALFLSAPALRPPVGANESSKAVLAP